MDDRTNTNLLHHSGATQCVVSDYKMQIVDKIQALIYSDLGAVQSCAFYQRLHF